MKNTNYPVVVPIHLDGLYVSSDADVQIATPTVDFNQLSNSNRAYLGESHTSTSLSTKFS